MQYPEITDLYRYDRDTNRALEIVRTGMMECPRASTFNDPFDCTIPFEIDYDIAEYLSRFIKTRQAQGADWAAIANELPNLAGINPDGSLSEYIKAQINQEASGLKQRLETLGVLCFTSDPLSILMWSHYGGKHQGICIGFARSPSNILGDIESCSPVRYSDEYPVPKYSENFRDGVKFADLLLFTKAREWAYEKEWRAIVATPDKKYLVPSPLSRLIVGCNSDPLVMEECRRAGVRLGIPVYRTKRVDRKFELALEQI